MRIFLATLALNEAQWLPLLYQQHKDWPGLTGWCFVESADRAYQAANPARVSPDGLSVDGTSEYLRQLAAQDSRIRYIPHGFSAHDVKDQGKCAARQCYLDVAEEFQPDWVIVLDADEFYPQQIQQNLNERLESLRKRWTGVIFDWRHIWHPPSLQQEPRFRYEVKGNLWSVAVCHVWRWIKGMRYCVDHNTPWRGPKQIHSLGRRMLRWQNNAADPYCVHMAFASDLTTRQAKHRYYVERGEGKGDKRQCFVDCRRAFETWQPGDTLPHDAKILPYDGLIPECFTPEGSCLQ